MSRPLHASQSARSAKRGRLYIGCRQFLPERWLDVRKEWSRAHALNLGITDRLTAARLLTCTYGGLGVVQDVYCVARTDRCLPPVLVPIWCADGAGVVAGEGGSRDREIRGPFAIPLESIKLAWRQSVDPQAFKLAGSVTRVVHPQAFTSVRPWLPTCIANEDGPLSLVRVAPCVVINLLKRRLVGSRANAKPHRVVQFSLRPLLIQVVGTDPVFGLYRGGGLDR
jgi:hypothetical protein